MVKWGQAQSNAAGRSQALPRIRKAVINWAVETFKVGNETYKGIKISYSRASTYLECPQKHYFGYVERIRPKIAARPLYFGSDFHKLLQFRSSRKGLNKAWAEISETYNGLSARAMTEVGDTYLEDLRNIFTDYVCTYNEREQPVETEHEFLIKIGKIDGMPVYFHGKIDEIYEDNDLGEHKTFKSMPDMSILAMNMQAVLYAKAWELETGVLPEKVRWDYIRSVPAKQPIWLEKTGRFSEASNSQITEYSWLRACEERGITDRSILLKADLYKPNNSNFFFRVNTTIVPQMVKTAWRGFKSVCKDIALRGNNNNVKNISRDCAWCNYRPICYAEFTGADVDYVKKTDYEVKETEENGNN